MAEDVGGGRRGRPEWSEGGFEEGGLLLQTVLSLPRTDVSKNIHIVYWN